MSIILLDSKSKDAPPLDLFFFTRNYTSRPSLYVLDYTKPMTYQSQRIHMRNCLKQQIQPIQKLSSLIDRLQAHYCTPLLSQGPIQLTRSTKFHYTKNNLVKATRQQLSEYSDISRRQNIMACITNQTLHSLNQLCRRRLWQRLRLPQKQNQLSLYIGLNSASMGQPQGCMTTSIYTICHRVSFSREINKRNSMALQAPTISCHDSTKSDCGIL